jgi:hypothetical protein
LNEGVTAEQVNGISPAPQLQNSTIPDEVSQREDVRSDVLAAIEKLKSSDPAEKPVAAADDTDQSASSDRVRNERGQFTKADESQPAPVTDADPPQDTQQAASQPIAAPKGWSADARAKWSTLDPSIQAEVMKRETDIDNGGRQWSEEKRTYEEALAPLKGFSSKYGIDDRTALTRLLDWQVALERNPREAIMQLAQLSGIDLSNPDQKQTQPQAVSYDPRVDGIAQIVSQFQDERINSQIDQFRNAPGHEHFDAVKVRMGQLIERDNALTLQQAYEQAIWLDEGIRSQLIAAQVQPTQQKAKDQQQVQKAKQAAASPRGSGPNGDAPRAKPEYATVREALVASARDAGWNI